jgi:error-prone DNA polymerase
MRLVRGISLAQVEGIERAQSDRPFTSMTDLIYRSGASRATIARLAAADAMRSLGLNRRAAVWTVLAAGHELPLFEGIEIAEPHAALPEATIEETVLQDYDVIGLSLNAHPIELIRKDLHRMGIQPTQALRNGKHGKRLRIAGLVLVRQRPATAKGIVFATLEDETGVANVIIPPDVYDRYRSVAHAAVALVAEGITQRVGEVAHLKVTRVLDLTQRPTVRRSLSRDFH